MSHPSAQAPYDLPPHPLRQLALVLGLAFWSLLQAAAIHEPRLAPYLPLALRRLMRARARLLAILTSLADGTWRTPRHRTPAPRQRPATPTPYLPRRHGWLGAVTDHHVRGHAAQLTTLLNDPATTRILATAPPCARAAAIRTLRGPARLLALDLPDILQLPGPPRPPRIRKPRPRPERPQGVLPTDRPIPRNVLAFARYNRRRFGKGA